MLSLHKVTFIGTESFRKWGPLITQKKWNDLFIDNGFSGIDVALPDVPVEAYRMTDVMVATASKKPAKALKIPALAIVAAESSQQQAIAQELKLSLELMEFPSEILSLPDLDAHKTELDSFIFLIEIEEPLLYNVGEKAFLTLQNLAHSAPDLLWVTSGLNANPASSMVTGLARCLQSENANFRFVTLALENRPMVSQAAKHIMQAFKSSFLGSPGSFEPEMKQKDELIYVNRIVEAEYVSKEISDRTTVQQVKPRRFGEEPLRSLVLNIAFPGLLDTLEFVDETEFPQPLAPDEVEIKVSASGLIFRDVLIALGQITDKNFGLECAGVVTRVGGDLHIKLGDRVCCWAPGSFRTFARCKAATAQKIPDAMSFSSAAALPVAHCTAYYALVHVARLKGGKSVLIHSGAGGTGQAAIQLAKYLNAEVYVTVGNEEKKKLVMDQYGIPEDHIFSSRTLSFGKGIKRVSKGRGVDVVLNSLSGEALRTSFECVAPYGCFIEIGKKDIYAHGDLPMFPFSRNVSFAGVDLAAMLTDNSALLGELMQEVMDLLRKKQIWVPVPLHCYSVSRIEEAFRYMQSGKNTGKIVVDMNNEDLVPVSNPVDFHRLAISYLFFHWLVVSR